MTDVPWGDLGVDIVIEATAQNRTREDFEKHLAQGAKRVILCVPQKTPPDITIVMGVNDDQLKPEHRIVSRYDNEWGYSNRVVDLIEILAAVS